MSLIAGKTLDLTDRSYMESEVLKKTEETIQPKKELNNERESKIVTTQNLAKATDDIIRTNREKEEKDREIAALRRNLDEERKGSQN